MVNESNKIIVKVGKKSRVQFANSKVYRAITANDLNALTNKFDDCHIVVIEDIDEDEQDAVKDACQNFVNKSEDNSVAFLLTSTDDVASGVADELACENIFYTISDLYKFIYEKYGFSVSIYLDDRKKLNSMDSMPDGVTDVFGDISTINGEEDTDLSDIIASIEEKDAQGISTDNTDETTESIEDISGLADIENNVTVAETVVEQPVKEDKQVATNNETTVNKAETTVNKAKTVAVTDNKHIETETKQVATETKATVVEDTKQSVKEDKQIAEETETTVTSEEATGKIPDDVADYIDKLEMQLRDAKYDYSEVVKDVRNASAKISKLEETVRLLTEEKEIMKKRFNELMVSDNVLEDPISLAEYGLLKEQIKQLEARIVELNSTIDSMKETIEAKELDINSNETTIEELNLTIADLKKQLGEINASIASGEIHKDVVNEYEEKIKAASLIHTKTVERLQVAEEDIANLHEEINSAKTLADTEKDTRLELFNNLMSSFVKIKELDSKLVESESNNSELVKKLQDTSNRLNASKKAENEQLVNIAELKRELEKTHKELSTSTENEKEQQENIDRLREELAVTNERLSISKDAERKQSATLEELKKELDKANKNSELASNISANDLTKLNNKIGQLEAKLSVTEEQLKQKEEQYNSLIETSGVDKSESSALLETNRTLETISKTLREQLGAVNKELEQAKRDKAEAVRQSNGFKAQVVTLQKSLQSMASIGVGSPSIQSSGPISVRSLSGNVSRSQIITVLGSGSFGITTTAMSIANRLAATSKVLYIDFDLVSPMADSWFKVNPMLQNIPGTINGNVQNTGLGLFIEHGTDIIARNMNNIIRPVSKTKGGGVHYLSGVYYTPELSKLASADYEGLFTLLTRNFQYIVIDFGRLGCSEVNDQIIKIISDVAFRNIVVSTTNPFEVRNLRKKIDSNHMDINKVVWLFNLCQTTGLDQNVRNIINPIDFSMLPRMEGFEQCNTFLRVTAIRDRFGTFVDNKVFGRR